MVTIRCTVKAQRFLGLRPLPHASQGTNALGDWYANVVPTIDGGVLLFVNERTLVAVAFPAGVPNPFQMFVRRVANLLSMIEIPGADIEREIEHYRDVQIGKTASRTVLGSMNEIAFQCQAALEDLQPGTKLSLSDLERDLAEIPHSALGFKMPQEIARELVIQRVDDRAV